MLSLSGKRRKTGSVVVAKTVFGGVLGQWDKEMGYRGHEEHTIVEMGRWVGDGPPKI